MSGLRGSFAARGASPPLHVLVKINLVLCWMLFKGCRDETRPISQLDAVCLCNRWPPSPSQQLPAFPKMRVPRAPLLGSGRPQTRKAKVGAAPLTNIHAQVHAEIHVLCPGVMGRLFAQDGEDAPVEVGLARRLVIAGDSDDGSPRAVPGHQVR